MMTLFVVALVVGVATLVVVFGCLAFAAGDRPDLEAAADAWGVHPLDMRWDGEGGEWVPMEEEGGSYTFPRKRSSTAEGGCATFIGCIASGSTNDNIGEVNVKGVEADAYDATGNR